MSVTLCVELSVCTNVSPTVIVTTNFTFKKKAENKPVNSVVQGNAESGSTKSFPSEF